MSLFFGNTKDKHRDDDFDNAKIYLSKAIGTDEKYARAHYYLGNLYNWGAYFADLDSKDEKKYREAARAHYTEAGRGYTVNPSEAESFMNFGMGLVYHRAYSKIKDRFPKRVTDKFSELNWYLTEAHEYYRKVTDQDQDFYFAMTGRGLIYKEKEYLSSIGFNGLNHPEWYIHCAMQELLHAKYIAEDRKDKESLRWLDHNLHDLERKLRDRQSGWPGLQAALSWVPALGSTCLESDSVPSENDLPKPLAQHYHRESIHSQAQ